MSQLTSGEIQLDDVLKGLNLVGQVLLRAQEAYQKHRELAAKVGVPVEELDAADERFLKFYDDPLGRVSNDDDET